MAWAPSKGFRRYPNLGIKRELPTELGFPSNPLATSMVTTPEPVMTLIAEKPGVVIGGKVTRDSQGNYVHTGRDLEWFDGSTINPLASDYQSDSVWSKIIAEKKAAREADQKSAKKRESDRLKTERKIATSYVGPEFEEQAPSNYERKKAKFLAKTMVLSHARRLMIENTSLSIEAAILQAIGEYEKSIKREKTHGFDVGALMYALQDNRKSPRTIRGSIADRTDLVARKGIVEIIRKAH